MARVNPVSSLNLTRIITDQNGAKKITRAIVRDAKENDDFMRDTLAEVIGNQAKRLHNIIAGDSGKAYFGLLMFALSEYAVSLYQRAMPVYDGESTLGVQNVTGSMATYMTSNVEAISYQTRAQGRFDSSSMNSAYFSIKIPSSAARQEQASGAEGMLRSVHAHVYNTGVPVFTYADEQKFAVLTALVEQSGGLHVRLRILMDQLFKRFILPPSVIRSKKKVSTDGWLMAIRYVEELTHLNRAMMKQNIAASLTARVAESQARSNAASGPRR